MKGSLHLISIRGIGNNFKPSTKIRAMTWKDFASGKIITHSPQGATLPDIINRCEREGICYELRAFPGLGYTIKRITNETPP